MIDFSIVLLADFTPMVGWTPNIWESDGKNRVFVNSPTLGFPVQTRRSKIAPGKTWVVGGTDVILDPAPRFHAKQYNTTPRVELAAGKYRISQAYRFAALPAVTWSGELTSGELELTGGYERQEQAGNMRLRYACRTRHEQEDTVSYAVFCQAETAGFSFDGRSFCFILAASEGKEVHLPYVQDRQYWLKPDGEYEIIKERWSAKELRMAYHLFQELPGIRFDTPDALREHLGKLVRRETEAR